MAADENSRAAPPSLERKRSRLSAEVRQNQILSAAIGEFVARGYEAASVSNIAKEAGMSKGNVYVHFPSKEALFEALLLRLLGRAGTDWHEMFKGVSTAKEFVDTFIDHAYQGVTADSVAVMRLMISEIHRVPALQDRWNASLLRDSEARQKVLNDLVERGVLRQGPLTNCFYIASSPIVFISVMKMVMPSETPLVDPDVMRSEHHAMLLECLAPQ